MQVDELPAAFVRGSVGHAGRAVRRGLDDGEVGAVGPSDGGDCGNAAGVWGDAVFPGDVAGQEGRERRCDQRAVS